MGIAYLDGPRLRRSLLAAADWVEADREELNRINVFPVPDGDTGTNFSLTLRAIAHAVTPLPNARLPEITKVMADACVLSAHGNSGLLLSQFLLGFRDGLADYESVGPSEVATGFRAGANRLASSLDDPVEGTILTVCRESADAAEVAAASTDRLDDFMDRVLNQARITLRKTPELLSALREAGVVDAGARGFVRVIEGVVRLIEGKSTLPSETITLSEPTAAAVAAVRGERDFQFCTEVLVRGEGFPPSTELRATLRPLGGSIVVLSNDDLLKVHIHTDTPDAVYQLAGSWGTVEETRAEDMRVQHQALDHTGTSDVAIVVDSSCDLTDAVVDQRGFVVTPLQVLDENNTYQDRIDITDTQVYSRMQLEGAVFSTSQPAPGAFAESYRDARGGADQVLCLTVSGGLSGTHASAQAATESVSGVRVFDSRSVSLGLGMLALRAHELIEGGLSLEETIEELHRVRDRSGGFITVDSLDNLVRSGRLGRGRAWLGQLLDIKPILALTPEEGKIDAVDRVRGAVDLAPRVLEHLDRILTPRPRRLRLGVAHADALQLADRLKTTLEERYRPHECLLGSVTAALGVHVGPGAWAVFYQIEEPAGEGPSLDEPAAS